MFVPAVTEETGASAYVSLTKPPDTPTQQNTKSIIRTAQSLEQPTGHEGKRRLGPNPLIGGEAARHDRGDRHEQDRPLEGGGGAELVADGPEEEGADGAHEEAAGKDGEGADGAEGGLRLGEEELADLGREVAEVVVVCWGDWKVAKGGGLLYIPAYMC